MEFVYVVKRFDLFERGYPHGLARLAPADMADVVDRIRERGFFVERRHAERDATLKQIIPYCVVVRDGGVFLMRRLSAGGEARLHGKRSVGVGGHINPIDDAREAADTADVLHAGLRREVEEELVVDGEWSAEPVGVLNDDTTDVGSVHFGLVSVIHVTSDVHVRETDMLEGHFVPRDELLGLLESERDSFESWSALVLDQFDAIAPAARPVCV